MAIAGFADTAPLDSNDTAEGRAHNRRVDVVILSQQVNTAGAAVAAPGPGPNAAPAPPQPASGKAGTKIGH